MFSGFYKEGLLLLDEFQKNNTKEYFEANRDRYNHYILEPNRAFVEEMGEHLQILHPNIHAEPKINRSLFKIFRDSRFHLNEPLKSKIGIIFWAGSGHRMQSSSFYLHYEPSSIFWAAGIRNFKPPLLKVYREYIQDIRVREDLHNILEELKIKGYNIPKPHFKRYPKDMNEDNEFSYLYLYRAIYAFKESKIKKSFFNKRILSLSFKYYQDMLPLFEWVYQFTLYRSKSI